MWFLHFYRAIISILAGAILYYSLAHKWWMWLCITILVRMIWYSIEHIIFRLQVSKNFQQHESVFKELYGPYGIRLINKAETDWNIKKNLSEVFTNNPQKLKTAVEQLEVMNTLFQAGFKPDGDDYLLHDLKLKYGKYRIEKAHSNPK